MNSSSTDPMPYSQPQPLGKHRLIQRIASLLIGIVIATIIGSATYMNVDAYQDEMRVGEQTAANLVRSAAQHASDAFKELDAVSAGMVERLRYDGATLTNRERLRALFANQRTLMPQIHGVFVYGRNGEWIVSDKDDMAHAPNNADRDYFVWHRDHPDDLSMHLSPAIRSRTTGDWIVPATRRLSNPDGSFAGIVVVSVFVEYFNRFYEGFHMDDNSIFVIAMRDGTIITRRPFDEAVIGTSLATGDIFRRYLPSASAGTARIISAVDHVDRINSYQQLDRYPLVIQAGMSINGILKVWRQGLHRSVAFAFGTSATLLLLGYVLLQQLRFVENIEKDLRRTERKLKKLAMEDALTGLSNRRKLDSQLAREVARARRQRASLAVLMIDIDYFKKYNDRYGHEAGDECLRAIANALKLCLRRPADEVFRYGGEEFAVMLPDTSVEGAFQIAENIRATVKGLSIPNDASEFEYVTLSIGVTSRVPVLEDSAALFLRSADEALYEAKHAGRNQVIRGGF